MQNSSSLPAVSAPVPGQTLAASQLPDIEDSRGFNIRELLTLLRSNAPLILIVTATVFALALVYILLVTPRYTALTTVQISDQTHQVLGKDQQDTTEQNEVSSPLETERFLQTQIDILNSRTIAERVAQRLNLMGNPVFFRTMGRRFPTNNPSQSELRDITLTLLLGAEESTLQRNSRLVSISFISSDPAFSAKVANTWAEEFIQANLQRRYDSSSYARTFVANQLNEAKAKLEQSERDLNAYARSAGLIKTRDPELSAQNGAATPNSVTTQSLLENNLLAAQATQVRINAEHRWHMVEGSGLLDSPEVIGSTTIGTLLAERAKNEEDLQHERAKHLDDYPTVKQLQAQLDSVNRQITAVANNIRESVHQQYETAVNNEKKMLAEVARLKSDSLAEQDRDVQYNLLAHDADTTRLLYESLLQRYKDLNAAAGITASNIAIIDTADVPIRPSSPKIVRDLALALLAGVLISAVLIAVRHSLDDAVKVPEDIENKLGIPFLGVIPKSGDTEPLEALRDPKSSVSESYNSLRSSLLYSTSRGLPRTLLITSSQAAEGKSTTSLAVATGIAKLGRRVVLIDVDMRRPSLHGLFKVENKQGLTSVLTHQIPIEEALLPSGIENLTIVPSGPIPPSPTDLLSSNVMAGVLDQLSERFDVVILDSPPVMGLADAPLLSAMVQGVIVVIQADRGRRGSLKNSLKRLRATNAQILGGVLTMFDPTKAANRYSEYYSYNYYYYKYSEDA